MRVIPDLSANIRVTVTMETATGVRLEEFAISSILGCPPQRKTPGYMLLEEYGDVFRAKVEASAMAAAQAVLGRVQPNTWQRLEMAGVEQLNDEERDKMESPADLFRNGCCSKCGKDAEHCDCYDARRRT